MVQPHPLLPEACSLGGGQRGFAVWNSVQAERNPQSFRRLLWGIKTSPWRKAGVRPGWCSSVFKTIGVPCGVTVLNLCSGNTQMDLGFLFYAAALLTSLWSASFNAIDTLLRPLRLNIFWHLPPPSTGGTLPSLFKVSAQITDLLQGMCDWLL